MTSQENESKLNHKSMKEKDKSSLNKINEEKIDVKINEKKIDNGQTLISDSPNNSYSLLPLNINQENNEISAENPKSKKRKKKLIKRQYFKNIYKKKSIIGLFLNLILWIWVLLYILNYNEIIIFPRGSLNNKKVHMVYSTSNSDSIIGHFISTLFYTFFNYYIVFIYPEVILIISYCSYVIYSLFNTEKDKFKDNKLFLSKNTYVILVILSFGEIYKLFARKYLDI